MTTATQSTELAGASEPAPGTPKWVWFSVFGALGAFLAVSVWWLVADHSILDFDSGRHVANTWAMHDAIGRGDLLAPITQDNINHYPPLLYLVGSLGMAIGGWMSIDSAQLAMNFVFVPMLALGCWAAARVAYGELAGVLAAVFALGTPMVVSTFHLYMLDVPQAAAVAATVGLVLTSRRFERVGMSVLAGVAGSAAMLLKPTSAICLGGFLIGVLIRGGWRNPRGLATFLTVGAVLCLPWYIEHLDQLSGLTGGFVGGLPGSEPTAGASATGTSYVRPARYSEENVFWYGWNLLNVQLLLPLFVSFIAGTIVAVVRFWRTRDPSDPTPELVLGGFVAYAGMTYLTLKDSRYTLPALVYVAVLGVAWLPALRLQLQRVAAGALVLAAAVNLIGISAGIGSRIEIKAPNAPALPLGERTARIYAAEGYLQSAPRDDSDMLKVLRAVREDGYRKMEVDPGGDTTFSLSGLQVLLRTAGLEQPKKYNPAELDADTVFMLRHPVPAGGPEPCGILADGRGIYLVRGPGNVVIPFESYELYCPR